MRRAHTATHGAHTLTGWQFCTAYAGIVQGGPVTREVWRSGPVVAASRSGDFGRVIAIARKQLGVSQGQLAEACGLTQSSLSRIENRGEGSYNMNTLARAAAYLHLPPGLVGLADSAANATAARKDSDPVNRRSFLAGAAAIAAPSTSTAPHSDDRASSIRVATAAYRSLDGTVPARQLLEPVRAHLRLVQELAQRGGRAPGRQSLAAAGSEIASFAAWLSWDMADRGSSRAWYGTAVASARQAGDPLLWAYQAGSLAQLEIEAGSATEALSLLAKARARLGPAIPAIANAWLSALDAEAHAALNNERAAATALDTCEQATQRIPHEEAPPWPWVFSFTPAKVARARIVCGVHLGRSDWVFDSVSAAGPMMHNGHAKQGALLMLEVADAHVSAGQVDAAFMLATQAVELGIELRSGRVVDRARTVRRRVSSSTPRVVRDFDERLHGVYL